MSKFSVLYTIHEQILYDENSCDVKKTYEHDLPHGKYLLQKMCESWNSIKEMHTFYDGILQDKIASAKMRPYIKTNIDGTVEYSGCVDIVGIPGFRFTQEVRDEIREQTGAQFCDGWGECFFGVETFEPEPGVFCIVD